MFLIEVHLCSNYVVKKVFLPVVLGVKLAQMTQNGITMHFFASFLLPTQQPQVRFSAFPILLMLFHCAGKIKVDRGLKML